MVAGTSACQSITCMNLPLSQASVWSGMPMCIVEVESPLLRAATFLCPSQPECGLPKLIDLCHEEVDADCRAGGWTWNLTEHLELCQVSSCRAEPPIALLDSHQRMSALHSRYAPYYRMGSLSHKFRKPLDRVIGCAV